MRRYDLTAAALVLPIILGILVGLPVAVLQLQGEQVTPGPAWLWWSALAGFVLAFGAAELLSTHPRRGWALVAFLTQAVLALAVTGMVSPGFGFSLVILVFGATLSVYVVPLWGTVVVVLINTTAAAIFSYRGQGLLEPAITALFYLVIQAVSVVTIVTWRRQQEMNQELAQAHIELSATGALLEESTRAAERLRISRDLHDVLGHQLSALALELEVASHRAQEPAREHVLRAREITKELLADVRGVVSELRLDSGDLRATLLSVVADVPAPEIHLEVAGDVVTDEARTTAVVRAVQEVLTNAIRHSAGENLWITVSGGDHLVLHAYDDGWGAEHLELGNGLRGIRERAEGLGGSAEFSRHEDGGFDVRVEVPV
ncbi:sensor histidine kinase [Bogoriella caseilytica]|uniref:Signal transduction histidine kinase n=1 Tax=Bogoriella caseilytica TaxID=56055 RepID=A0A3N2B9X8_9MICO|nr:histidine kinase [Bogoriella caseilytica]ROR72057.1 signal transduction histidine kinase [Bogoriella caseilytica]